MDRPILLVEDTPSLSMVYEAVIRKAGYRAECVFSVGEARKQFAKTKHKIVLLDLLLPDGDGMQLMSEFITQQPDIKIIVITANGSINRAVEAMRLGSFDFLVKPFDETRLLSAVENARKALEFGVDQPDSNNTDVSEFQGFTGSSDAMQDIYKWCVISAVRLLQFL